MIVLDTHIWIWWVHGEKYLTASQAQIIEDNETDVIDVIKIVQINKGR